jgi:hypothetical protein
MPYYEYHCLANGRTLEVRHGMSEQLETWGALAERAGVDPGDTPNRAPIERLMSAPVPLASEAGSGPAAGGCGTGCACVPRA